MSDLEMPRDISRTWRDRVVRPEHLIELATPGVSVSNWIFERCRFEGPMVIVFTGNSQTIDARIDMGGAPKPAAEALFWEFPADREIVIGAIALESCLIERCSFARVGFAGTAQSLASMREQLGLA